MSLTLACLLAILARCIFREFSLANHAAAVQATVTERHITSDRDKQHILTLRFPVANGNREDARNVGSEVYEAHAEGSQIEISYDRTNPENWTLGRQTEGDAQSYSFYWGLGWLGLCLVAVTSFGAFRDHANKDMEWLANWSLGSMTIKSITKSGGKDSVLRATGSIIDESGRQRDLKETLVPSTVHVDQPIAVLYDPDNNESIALDSVMYAEIDV